MNTDTRHQAMIEDVLPRLMADIESILSAPSHPDKPCYEVTFSGLCATTWVYADTEAEAREAGAKEIGQYYPGATVEDVSGVRNV